MPCFACGMDHSRGTLSITCDGDRPNTPPNHHCNHQDPPPACLPCLPYDRNSPHPPTQVPHLYGDDRLDDVTRHKAGGPHRRVQGLQAGRQAGGRGREGVGEGVGPQRGVQAVHTRRRCVWPHGLKALLGVQQHTTRVGARLAERFGGPSARTKQEGPCARRHACGREAGGPRWKRPAPCPARSAGMQPRQAGRWPRQPGPQGPITHGPPWTWAWAWAHLVGIRRVVDRRLEAVVDTKAGLRGQCVHDGDAAIAYHAATVWHQLGSSGALPACACACAAGRPAGG